MKGSLPGILSGKAAQCCGSALWVGSTGETTMVSPVEVDSVLSVYCALLNVWHEEQLTLWLVCRG
jgi:hypothetical protein